MQKYYVDYVQGCTSSLREFDSYVEALEFALKVYLESQHCKDNWVNRIFKGTILVSE